MTYAHTERALSPLITNFEYSRKSPAVNRFWNFLSYFCTAHYAIGIDTSTFK